MSTPAASPSLAEPLQKIRSVALLMVIGYLLTGIGDLMIVLSMPTILAAPAAPHNVLHAIFGSIVAIIFLLIGFTVILIGLYMGLVPGVRRLSKVDDRFSTASTLIRIGYVWGVILLIVGIIVAVMGIIFYLPATMSHGGQFITGGALMALAAGMVIIIISLILVILGYIGIIILAFKFNDVEHDGLYLAAGILFILGIIIPFAMFVAWILMYIALGRSIERLKTTPQPPAPASAPSLV
ncbi:MAG: DUF973 family protein [Ignisphaera sp.]